MRTSLSLVPGTIALLGALVSPASPLDAQPPDPAAASVVAPSDSAGTLTLEQALRLARERNPLVRAAAGRRAAASATARVDAAWPNPSLEWRRENFGASTDAGDEFRTVTQPIGLSGRRLALRGAARATDVAAVADSVAAVRGVELATARAYWRAALARSLAQLAADQRGALDGVAEYDEARLARGAVAENVAMRARLEADRARVAQATADAEWARARADLSRVLAMPVDSAPLPLPLTMPDAPASAPRRAAAGDGAPADALPDDVPTEAEAVRDALAQRPELRALRARADAARRRVSAERRGVLDDVVVTGGSKIADFGDRRGVLGVVVPIPLFNQNGPARERARGEQLAAEAELADAENQVRAEAVAAVRAYADLTGAARAAGAGLDRLGGEVADIARAAYREGGVSLLEVLEAQRARADARTTALRWTVDVHLARLELTRATGAPLVASTAPRAETTP